jgi:hypothetical protein
LLRRLNGDRELLLNTTWPLDMPAVNEVQSAVELEELRNAVNSGTPYGSEARENADRDYAAVGIQPSPTWQTKKGRRLSKKVASPKISSITPEP